MTPPLDARRVQRHLREGMRAHSRADRVGAFTAFVHPESPHGALNLAIPEEPPEGRRVPVIQAEAAGHAAVPDDDPAYSLMLLRAHFAARHRIPRVELIDERHPGLADLLRKEGFHEESATPVLACTPDTWKRVDPPPGVRVEALHAGVAWPTARRYLEVQREAFGLRAEIPERAPPGFWPALDLAAGVLAVEGDEAAGAAGLASRRDGLADVRGLAVREAHRGRGIASFLLSALARVGHETGADAVLLLPEEGAERLAARAGYERVATLLAFRWEGAAEP